MFGCGEPTQGPYFDSHALERASHAEGRFFRKIKKKEKEKEESVAVKIPCVIMWLYFGQNFSD